ncbi:MAG TPA: hypothetical protein PLZ53_10360, partial [Candidatus Hydrogenedentes bacterium]|nr:hypothetical protein [Candidatus Hydrogenedentota bacterium]
MSPTSYRLLHPASISKGIVSEKRRRHQGNWGRISAKNGFFVKIEVFVVRNLFILVSFTSAAQPAIDKSNPLNTSVRIQRTRP